MENNLLTKREIEVINKKINNKPLSQIDSNCLSKFVRPKLKKIANMDAKSMLERLNYNPQSRGIENKIKKTIFENIKKIDSIIIFGSAIQTGYADYNDIDILILTKEKYWKNQWENLRLCNKIEKSAKKHNLSLDVQIISKGAFLLEYSKSPSLIYQMKDHKLIYGKLKVPKKIELSKIDLRMKLDWSDVEDSSNSLEIYNAIRNTLLVRFLMNKIIDNYKLKQELITSLGLNLASNLKSGTAQNLEKKYALNYLTELTEKTRQEIMNAEWEKIKI